MHTAAAGSPTHVSARLVCAATPTCWFTAVLSLPMPLQTAPAGAIARTATPSMHGAPLATVQPLQAA